MLNPLKVDNLSNVALQLLKDKATTKQTLCQEIGLSNTTISDAINSMLKIGLIEQNGLEVSGGGRRSVIYQINPKYGQFIGIDLHLDDLLINILDASGQRLKTSLYKRKQSELVIQFVKRVLKEILASKNCNRPLAIGIGINGEIDYKNQIVLKSEELLWENVHLKELVERWYYIPTYIDSSINGLVDLESINHRNKDTDPILIYSYAFPNKVAISIDQNTLRGNRNECGKIDDNRNPCTCISQICELLGIQKIIAYHQIDSQELKEIKRISKLKIEISFCAGGREELARGMAIQAEKLWFNSIYFVLL